MSHMKCQQDLNVLATEKRRKSLQLQKLQDEYLRSHHEHRVNEEAKVNEKRTLGSLQQKLRKCITGQKEADRDKGKLQVMLRRTKNEWVSGMARMQDIGNYAEDQVQGLFRGSQWRMYNEMLREASAFQLTELHQKRQDKEAEQGVVVATRRKELDVLEELNQMMVEGRVEAARDREEAARGVQKKEVKKVAKKETKLTLSELQRATNITTKVEHAMAKLARRGHRFSEYDAALQGRTVLDLVLEQLQHTQTMGEQAMRAKADRAEKVEELNAQLERLEAELSRTAFSTETPEPVERVKLGSSGSSDAGDAGDMFKSRDIDDRGNLSPRARGHGFNVNDLLRQEWDVQRQISARMLVLPQMEDRATKVTQWFKRIAPKLEGFECYQTTFAGAEKMAQSPAGGVLRWLKCMDATLSFVKNEVGTIRADTGMAQLDWNEFEERGLAALEEGKVVCVDESVNLRVLTEASEIKRLKDLRRKMVVEKVEAGLAAQKTTSMGGGGKLEEIRAAAEAQELQERTSVALEREDRMDSMDEATANAYSRDRVRIAHDSHRDELQEKEHDRQRAGKERRRRPRRI